MKNQLTNIIFILDKSGSMSGKEEDSIGGFNTMLNKQKNTPGAAILSTVVFNDNMEYLHKNIPIDNAQELTLKDYLPGGCTALLDALGNTIANTDCFYNTLNFDERPHKTIVIIITDGYENASREYSLNRIKSIISKKQELEDWEFIFLGANIDAIHTADSFGIARNRAANFHNDSKGIAANFGALSDAVCSARTSGLIEDNWKDLIDEDFNQRKND